MTHSAQSTFAPLEGRDLGNWFALIGFGALIALGAAAALYMEQNGHWVSGMNNQVVWGLPHVFALFLIVAASGAHNVASIGSVFGKEAYKPFSRLSGLTAIALLAGGLSILVLDLGRSDRLITFVTHLHFTSIFALNVFLYSGFFGLVVIYLWTMMDRRGARFYPFAAVAAFVWRLVLTTGTGSIFGFILSRTAFHSTLMAPLFIALSLSFGLAVFLVIVLWLENSTGRASLSPDLIRRVRVLLAVLTAASLYFVVVHNVTNYYLPERRDYESFMLFGGNVYSFLLWLGFGLAGSVAPIVLLLCPDRLFAHPRAIVAISALLVIIGGYCFLYAFVIGGEAFPIEMFPGKIVSSSFFDGVVASYCPTLPEVVLGLGGLGVAGMLVTVGLWALPVLPGDPS